MDQMQNEAMDRLRQMYSKSHKPKSDVNVSKPEHDKHVEEPPAVVENIKPNSSESLLDVFMRDKEKSLVMLLIVILINESTDPALILALMYLIL